MLRHHLCDATEMSVQQTRNLAKVPDPEVLAALHEGPRSYYRTVLRCALLHHLDEIADEHRVGVPAIVSPNRVLSRASGPHRADPEIVPELEVVDPLDVAAVLPRVVELVPAPVERNLVVAGLCHCSSSYF